PVELVSRQYIDTPLRMMRAFGAHVATDTASRGESLFTVPALGNYTARQYVIEPDASSASYAFAAAAATGLTVEVPGLSHGALQGDYQFTALLEQLACRIERLQEKTRIHGAVEPRTPDVDMLHISDTVMTLAAIAPLLPGKTTIRNIYNIRIKETDRLEATVNELRRLGQKVDSGRDWLSIEPAPVTPAIVKSYSDHRMAMSFAILGLARAGIQIEDPACVAKTYPTFWDDLRQLYAHCGQPAGF